MTERTKIERVGGHLLIGERTAVSLHDMRISMGYDPAGRDCIVINGAPAIGWTAREILEVAYGRVYELMPTIDQTEPEIPAGKALVSIDVMAQMKAKDEEIADLKERLERKRRIHESVNHEESAAYRRLNQLLHDATAGAFLPAAAADEIERQREEIAVLRSNLQCAEEVLRLAYEHLVVGRCKEATRIVGAHRPASIRKAAKVER